MVGPMAKTQSKKSKSRRFFSEEFKQEAVQMLLDGHSAPSVAEALGLSGPNALYRWKRETLQQARPAARTLGERVYQLEEELRRVAGAEVRDVMSEDPPTIAADATVEDLATLMHESDVTHVSVVDDEGHVVGIVARGDLVRFIARTT